MTSDLVCSDPIECLRALHALAQQQALELLLDKMKQTRSNVEFPMRIQKTTPAPGNGD
ncbi:hypothetical protein [Streptomyces sp. NPDC014995]|uniref:hypothetical protein n=1 Tax=Streptomyces sp. NPDC014995 TaxID=3364936 RepID=UPI0036FE0ED2